MAGAVVTEQSWAVCFKEAEAFFRCMQYEQAIEACLDFLHRYQHPPVASPSSRAVQRRIGDGLNIVFTCGGNASRWAAFLGLAKQLVDVGDGLPLVQRSVNQFRASLPGATFYLLTRFNRNDFSCIEGVQCISRRDNVDRPILLEILEQTETVLAGDRDILVVYGDVYFSDLAIRRIRNKIVADDSCFAMFGRRFQNIRYGNTGGEDFAVFIPRSSRQIAIDYHVFLERIYVGMRLYRFGTWELITLLSVLKQRATSTLLPAPFLIDGDVVKTFHAMASTWQRKDFHTRHWIDIDDETEDFDFPCEYIERLFRMVQWVGADVERFDVK